MIVGTYSSLFIATPIMFETAERSGLQQKIQEAEAARLQAEKERQAAKEAFEA